MRLLRESDLEMFNIPHKINLQEVVASIEDEVFMKKKAVMLIEKQYATFSEKDNFDVFLSHSYDDAEKVYKLKLLLENEGLSVFVDWLDEDFLDRENVSAKEAEMLRLRMRNCKCLIFATSSNSTNSLWMPWELGFFDGVNGKIAIMPVVPFEDENKRVELEFVGQEYLGIYPCIYTVGNLESILLKKGKNILNENLKSWIREKKIKESI